MLAVDVLCCGALALCWTRLCAGQGHGPIPDHSPMATGDGHAMSSSETLEQSSSASAVPHPAPRSAPCYVDDIFAALREGAGSDGELAKDTPALFGICTASDSSPASVLLELSKETSRHQRGGLEILHPTAALVSEEGAGGGALVLTFDLPRSPLLKLSPVLLLAFQSPLKGGEGLDVTFSSQSLTPDTQSACISGETQYVLLTGKASEGEVLQKWRISVEPKSPDMKQNLKDVFIGEKSGSSLGVTLLLLFSGGTDTRRVSGSPPASSQTFSFLCELRRFLCGVLPQDHPDSPQIRLDSVHSMPPLSLGVSSSEMLLAGLINSSYPTVFSFAGWSSALQVHHGQLALSPALLEELRQRVEQVGLQILGSMRAEEVGHGAAERLRRLNELSALPKKEPAAGENQYRAFLLLKALQTVAHAHEQRIGPRTTRADPDNQARGSVCGLKSLTISLEKHLVGPNTAAINNCHGSCAFPLFNGNNHAVLLNSHIESGNVEERAPCCVPVAYDPLEVVDLNEHGTYLSIKPDIIAKECGCR